MGTVAIRHYPFDYHTHFWGILPVHPAPGKSARAPSLERAIYLFYNDCDDPLTSLDAKRRIFALCLREAFTLFSKWFPSDAPPSFPVNQYARGECFVENALIAWNLLAQDKPGEILPSFWAGIKNPDDGLSKIESALERLEKPILGVKLSKLPPKDITAFEIELDALVKSGVLSVAGAGRITTVLNTPDDTTGDLARVSNIYLGPRFFSTKLLKPQASIYRYYDYFNNLMLSSNEFTPFDDAYMARDALKDLSGEGGSGTVYSQTYLINETNTYYEQEGITHTQLSMGRKDKGPLYDIFNLPEGEENAWASSNKVLYHNTNHNIGSDVGDLYMFLEQAVKDFNSEASVFTRRVIGVDFLGAEDRIDFETLFEVIEKFKATLRAPDSKRSFTLRIHCGEGSGSAPYNRSVLGQMCIDTTIAAALADDGPYRAFIDRLVNFRPTDQRGATLTFWPETLDLAQKIFSGPSYDMRFNIFSSKTHDRIAAIAESNMLALYHAATLVNQHGHYVYGPNSVFEHISIRLGHGQHARQYIHALAQNRGLAKGFRRITFDTNLGSNYITGSSSNIMSPEDFNRAEGIRTLTSFAPARYVMQAINAVFGKTAVSDMLYRTAFPLLVGSDGQGVEHTNLERENIRGLVLSVLRSALGTPNMTDKDLLDTGNLVALGLLPAIDAPAQPVTFMFDDAVEYWRETVGDPGDLPEQTITISGGAWISEERIEPVKAGFSGFEYVKAPEFDVRWG